MVTLDEFGIFVQGTPDGEHCHSCQYYTPFDDEHTFVENLGWLGLHRMTGNCRAVDEPVGGAMGCKLHLERDL